MKISALFDAGNIEVISADHADNVQLNIRTDAHSDFMQWFYFRVQHAQDQDCTFNIMNASQCAYTEGWHGYRAVASYDREEWFRVETAYDGQVLSITHKPEHNSVYYAFFAPYSNERHQDLLAWTQLSPLCVMHDLGNTLDGRDLNLLAISDDALHGSKELKGRPKKLNIWLIARQHPGESMAEWFMEGFLQRLLDADDAHAKHLLQHANFFVVPNMNPDGSVRGHLRTNAAGANLNREWLKPSLEKSPEVYYVRQKMSETGVDLFLDIHGDEALPYNFVAGGEGNPSYSPRIAQLEQSFKDSFITANLDFQTEQGYPSAQPGQSDLRIAANYVGETFDCLSFTLEMPFKDNANRPDSYKGWSPERSMKLGESIVQPICAVLPDLR